MITENKYDRLLAETLEEVNKEIANFDGPFGLWIHGLFGYTPRKPYDDIPFSMTRDLFLDVLKQLLDDGKIVAFPPEEFYENGKPTVPCRSMKQYRAPDYPFDNIWNVPSEDVVQYMRDHWPNDVVDADDIKLNNFWFDNYCPRIGWYDEETDSIIAS